MPAHLAATGLADYGWYIVLGAASGIVATILPEVFYRIRDAFGALRIPAWTKPALGGLGCGLLALDAGGFWAAATDAFQEAIDGHLALHSYGPSGRKMVALSLTVSCGGSGGVFAPSLFVGAMLGGALAGIFHHDSSGLVIVGMAAVFGSAGAAPIATLLMVAEMTRRLPASGSRRAGRDVELPDSSQSLVVFQVWKLLQTQVAGRADSPAHRAENVRIAVRLLEQGKVSLPPHLTHLHLAALLQSGIAFDLRMARSY